MIRRRRAGGRESTWLSIAIGMFVLGLLVLNVYLATAPLPSETPVRPVVVEPLPAQSTTETVAAP